jgi:hypothetical protein
LMRFRRIKNRRNIFIAIENSLCTFVKPFESFVLKRKKK